MLLQGTICVITACTLSSIGVNVQKKSHSIKEITVQYMVFLSGLLCMALSAVFDFTALYFLSQLQIGILGSLGLILNTIISVKGFRERVSPKQIAGLVFIGLGIALATYGAYVKHSEPDIAMWNTKRTESALLIVFIISNGLFTASFFTASFIPFAALTGLLGATMVFFAKYITVASSTVVDNHQLLKAIALTSQSAIAHVYFYNKALSRGKTSTVVPIHQLFWLLGCLIYGTVAFSENLPVQYFKLVCMIFGCLLCIVGLFFNFSSNQHKNTHTEYSPVDQELPNVI